MQQSNFIKTALRHGCSPINLLHIFRTPFPKNTPGWLLLNDGFYKIFHVLRNTQTLVVTFDTKTVSRENLIQISYKNIDTTRGQTNGQTSTTEGQADTASGERSTNGRQRSGQTSTTSGQASTTSR